MELTTLLAALGIVLDLAIAAGWCGNISAPGDAGFLWLALATGIWPLITRLLPYGELPLIDKVARHQPVGFYPFSLVESGKITLGQMVTYLNATEQIAGICLLSVAVLYLLKTSVRRAA